MTKTIVLDNPITRGEESIAEVSVRCPRAGEMRGINAADLLQLNVDALIKILPRVTTPMLTESDVCNLSPADLVQLGGEVAFFLVPKQTDYLTA